MLNRVVMTLEYRTAILVGFIGAFTTFSTFALETVYLLEQGNVQKAALNILVSVGACIFVVWLGLLFGRYLFTNAYAVVPWQGGIIPIAMLVTNAMVAFLIGVFIAVLPQKTNLALEYHAAIIVVSVGAYLTMSGLYLVLYLIEHGYGLVQHTKTILTVFAGNVVLCLLAIGLAITAVQTL